MRGGVSRTEPARPVPVLDEPGNDERLPANGKGAGEWSRYSLKGSSIFPSAPAITSSKGTSASGLSPFQRGKRMR